MASYNFFSVYYPCSENKGADQLREADLRLCFRIGQNPVFSRCGSNDERVLNEVFANRKINVFHIIEVKQIVIGNSFIDINVGVIASAFKVTCIIEQQ